MNIAGFDTNRITRKHGGKVKAATGALSATALIFLYDHFTPKTEFEKQCVQCKEENQKHWLKHSELWQKIMDHELEIDRLKRP